MEEQNVAVIGMGKMGLMHCCMLSVVPGVRLAAVVDKRKGVENYIRGMGIEAPFYDSLDTLFARAGDLRGAVIATPQNLHRPIAEACLRKGIGILSEKPISHTMEDADSMLRVAEEFPALPAAVAYMKAHYPIYRRLQALVAAEVLGPIEKVRARSAFGQVLRPHKGWIYEPAASGGGVLINSACHLLHILHFLFGPAGTVEASTTHIHSVKVEDEASLAIEFQSRTNAEFTASWSTPGYDTEFSEITIEGENGKLRATDDMIELDLEEAAAGVEAGPSKIRRWDLEQAAFNLSPDYGGDGYYYENLDFVECLRDGDRKPLVSFRDAWEVQRTIDAAYRSAAGAGNVDLGEAREDESSRESGPQRPGPSGRERKS